MLGRLIAVVLGLVPWDARRREVDDLLSSDPPASGWWGQAVPDGGPAAR